MQIFLRYAAKSDYLLNTFSAMAYDTRMLYILSGSGEMRYAHQTVPLHADVLCYYPAGTLYFPVASSEDPLTFITLNFDFSQAYLQQIYAIPSAQPSDYCPAQAHMTHLDMGIPLFEKPFTLENAWHFRNNFLRIPELYRQPTPYARQAAAALLQSVCLELADFCAEPQNHVYQQVTSYIEQHYHEPLTNQYIAQALHYHPNYLNIVFRRCAGITIHRYCMQVRLQKATELLQQNVLSIAEIAAAVGFENGDHFSNRFRLMYGLTPTAYRKKVKLI